MVHDVILPGAYARDVESDDRFIVCRIPSIYYLESETKIGIPPDFSFIIEVSMDGETFTNGGIYFKYILND